jgi:hypothetical protein
MTDDRDPFLTQLFAEQGEPADAPDFMAELAHALDRDQRRRRVHRIGLIIAAVIVAVLLAPWIALATASAIGAAAAGVAASGPLLDLPMAALAAGSIAATFLPVVYLGITRRW